MNQLRTPSKVCGFACGLLVVLAACPMLLAGVAQKVTIGLSGSQINNGGSVTKTSGTFSLPPATTYHYKIDSRAEVRGSGDLTGLLPKGTTLGPLLESIRKGSSALLEGQFTNTPGTLPAQILNRRISGSRNLPGFGKLSVSVTLLISIDAAGVVTLKVDKMKISGPAGKVPGNIRFGKNSRILVATNPL
jgi:hypothetical protein